jgi:hypothetical protein
VSKKYLLKFRNLDLTKDINERFTSLITPGIMKGGEITTIPSQLKVNVAPWKIFNRQGFVVEETNDVTTLDVSPGQTSVIALKVLYYQNQPPIAEFEVIELGIFNGLPNQSDYIVFGHVQVPLTATEVLDSFIDLKPRQVIDPIGRRNLRGVVTSTSLLPLKDQIIGDLYLVCDGVGGTINQYGWNGFTWVSMTDVLVLQALLTQHRQNLLANEKHLSDAEKFAVEGTFGSPSSTNKFVTDTDPRIPTQDENDALVGSTGTPSTTNKYVTQALQFAQPATLAGTAGVDPLVVSLGQGPVYLGRGGINTYQQYFKLYHNTLDREYLNSDRSIVDVVAVYKDAGLTQLISDPSSEPLTSIDVFGFYIGGPLYIKFNQVPDLAYKLVFGKRSTLGTYKLDFLMDNQPRVAQINRELLTKFEEITGIPYDQTLIPGATNTELYNEIGDVKKYINANTSSDFVVTNFDKMNSIPQYEGDFENNVGLMSYKYQNSPAITYTYNPTTGLVTYTGSPNLGQVLAGHVFIDGSGKEFKVTAVGANAVNINNRDGSIPVVINTTITKTQHGSIKVDNNPRQINLSTMQLVQFRERISAARMSPVKDEYHPVTGQLAFEIADPLRSVVFREQRLRAYGNIQTRDVVNALTGPNAGPKTQIYSVNSAVYSITGQFTDLELLADCRIDSPTVTVNVDGITTYTVDLSAGGKEVSFDTFNEVKQKTYTIATNLADGITHTVEIIIPDAVPEFVFYGFDLIRRNYEQANLLPGRAFVQGDLITQDAVEVLTLNPVAPLSRGGISNVLYDRDLNLESNFVESTEFDGVIGAPGGSAVAGSNTLPIGFGLTKFNAYYRANDLVKIVTSTQEETKKLISVAGGVATFDSNLSITGVANLVHLCSTTAESYDPEVESRRITAQLCGLATIGEFRQFPPLVVDRNSIMEDGVTKFTGNQISFTSTGVEGYNYGIAFPNASSRLRIAGCCSSLEIIVANATNTAFQYTVNGSVIINKSSTSSGYRKIKIFSNGRFQTWEVDIFNATGLIIAGFIFKEPAVAQRVPGLAIGEIKYLARYQTTNLNSAGILPGANYPIGSIAFDAYSSFVRFYNGIGTGWSSSIDWSKLYGRYNVTKDSNGAAEWVVYGTMVSFEYTATSDSGYALVLLNGVIARTSNFPVVYRGMSAANGIVDQYNAVPERRRVEISDLPYGRYVVRVQVASPFSKNSLSSDFNININQIFYGNSNGLFGYANELARSSNYYLGYSNQYDRRDFGNGTKSFDDLVAVVGDAYNLADVEVDDSTIDGGSFV